MGFPHCNHLKINPEHGHICGLPSPPLQAPYPYPPTTFPALCTLPSLCRHHGDLDMLSPQLRYYCLSQKFRLAVASAGKPALVSQIQSGATPRPTLSPRKAPPRPVSQLHSTLLSEMTGSGLICLSHRVQPPQRREACLVLSSAPICTPITGTKKMMNERKESVL